MGFLGVIDDIRRRARHAPPMRAYTSGPLEQAEVLKTWSFFDKEEPTPTCPDVSVLQRIFVRMIRSLTSWLQGTPTVINQDEHEPIIREHLKELGCLVELETELIDIEQDDAGVHAKMLCPRDENGIRSEETARFSYIVGADGARGTTMTLYFNWNSLTHTLSILGVVRKLLKLTFLGKTQSADAIAVADVEIKKLTTDVSIRRIQRMCCSLNT